LRCHLLLLSKTPILQAVSKEKYSFKALCWSVNENCEVDVAIDRAGYHFKTTAGNKLLFRFSSFFSLCQSYLRVFMELFLCHLCCAVLTAAANDNSEKESTIRVELRVLLISGTSSRTRNGQSC